MVGRVREQARIAAWLADDGSAYPLLIEGEAGMGKSTLVRFAMHKAEELGVPVVLVAGSRIERYTPYYVWRSVPRVPAPASAARPRRLGGHRVDVAHQGAKVATLCPIAV